MDLELEGTGTRCPPRLRRGGQRRAITLFLVSVLPGIQMRIPMEGKHSRGVSIWSPRGLGVFCGGHTLGPGQGAENSQKRLYTEG